MDFGISLPELKRAEDEGRLPDTLAWTGLAGKFRWLGQMYLRGNTELVYGQAFHMAGFLDREFGHDRLLEFIAALPRAGFADAFGRIFGMPPPAFRKRFIGGL